MFNADSSDIAFTLPPTEPGTKWEAALDTDGTTSRARNKLVAGGILSVSSRSLVVLRQPQLPETADVSSDLRGAAALLRGQRR